MERNPFACFTENDKTNMMKIAMMYAKNTPFDHTDLFQEACLRLLDGRRARPRNADPVRHFVGVMRSIASEWKRKPPIWVTETIAVDSQERNQNTMIDAARLVALFDDDAVAQKLIVAMMDGARGTFEGFQRSQQTEYESKRIKILRRIDRFVQAQSNR